jgi:hypothetical protein
MYEYTPDKTYYCAKCGEVRQDIYSPCPVCGYKKITEKPVLKAHTSRSQVVKKEKAPLTFGKVFKTSITVVFGLILVGATVLVEVLLFFGLMFCDNCTGDTLQRTTGIMTMVPFVPIGIVVIVLIVRNRLEKRQEIIKTNNSGLTNNDQNTHL